MDHAELLTTLKTLPESALKPGSRLVPTSFNPDDSELRGFPIALDWNWPSSEQFLRSCGAVGVMMRLPLFWQLEVPLRNACVSAGAFIFVNDRGNMPLGAEALRSAEISCVVTDAKDVFEFSNYLREKSRLQPSSWLIIHPGVLFDRTFSEIDGTRHAHEVHLFPGVPVLEQCEALQSKPRPEFHFASDVSWNPHSNTITMTGEAVLRLKDYALPFSIKEVRQCSCGRPVISHSPL